MIHRYCVLCVVLCSATCEVARAAEDDTGAWLTAAIAGPIKSASSDRGWRYLIDTQYRYLDASRNVSQIVFRPSVGLRLSDSVEVWAGYMRFENDRQRGPSTHENRLWQHVNWKAGRWLGGNVTMRVRLEQRSLSSGDDVGIVVRYMAKYTRPLASRNDRYVVMSIEQFVDLRDTDWGADSGLSQNRVYIGGGQHVNERSIVEVGYMNQYRLRDSAADSSNHLAMVTYRYNF